MREEEKDGQKCCYLLTIGVLEAYRKLNVGINKKFNF
jgi:hypothetical protein